jgi:ATP-binding cassette, subfamily B, bacterial
MAEGALSRAFHNLAGRRRRVPVINQLSNSECGAACLAMILGYHGRRTTISECRAYCEGGRDGVSAQAIASAAQHFGLLVKAYALEPDDLESITLPAIVHWGFNHFVVVEKKSPGKVSIVDPAFGRQHVTAQTFDENFTGVALTFERGPLFNRAGAAGDNLWLSYVKTILRMPRSANLFAQVIAASILIQLLALALPLFTKLLIDRILPFKLAGLLHILGAGIVVILLAHVLIGYLRESLLLYLRGRLDAQLMVGFVEHLLSLPFRFFQQRASGDLLMRLESSTLIRETVTGNALSIVLDAGFMLTYVVVLLTLQTTFGLLVLALGGLQFFTLFLTARHVRRLMQSEIAANSAEQSYAVEMLRGIATIKACGVEDGVLERWSGLFFNSLNISVKRGKVSLLISTTMGLLHRFSPLIVLWVGAHSVLQGRLSIGSMLAINAIAMYVLSPITALVERGQQLQLVKAHLVRINDVMAASPEPAGTAGQPAKHVSLKGRIDVEHLEFKYDRDSPPVLRDISFSLAPGQTLAVVGPTGSGKSTLALLLLGLYEPTRGAVRFDGIPLHEIDRRRLRNQIGVVLQDSFSFSASIRQNITLTDPHTPFERVVAAAKTARIHDQIEKMPMGYETPVGESALSLSGGERQRMALARALLHDPRILILDEATSHLDVQTEHAIHRNLKNLKCTKIVIAHRLTTVRNADNILVMEQGGIVEQGTHVELLRHGGRYAEMVRSQLDDDSLVVTQNHATLV